MGDAIIAAMITGGITLLGIIVSTLYNMRSSAKHSEANYQRMVQENASNYQTLLSKLEQQSREDDLRLQAKIENLQAATNIKLDELTREVREHNQFARRVPVLEEKAKRTDRRLDELEKRTGG